MFNHPFALELAYIAVEEAIRLGASYADARYELRHREDVRTRNGRLALADSGIERGLGVRVLVRGSWGYVGVSEPTRHDVTVAAKRAVDGARAAAILQDRPVELSSATPQRSIYRTPIRRDPLAVPLEDKLELLFGIDERLRGVKGITLADAHVSALRQRKIFVSSEGSELDQELVTTAVGYRAGAPDDRGLQVRSFPGGPDGMVMGRGWELVQELPLLDSAEEVAHEAVALAAADECPNDATNVILTGSLLAHHLLATTAPLFELDRVVGFDPGGSFLRADRLGAYELGGAHLSIAADAEASGGAGTYGFDDEGVAAQRIDLVDEGRFTGYLTGRETAHRVGLEGSQGAARAGGWMAPPLIRASNVTLDPGGEGAPASIDDLVADTRQGVLLDGPRAFGLDAFGRCFTGAAEVAWEIKDGARGRMLKNPTYQGRTSDFWRSCDALCGEDDWGQYGRFAQPKGQPTQRVAVGAGAPSGRFTQLAVGHHHRRPPQVADGAPLPLLDEGKAEPQSRGKRGKRKSKSSGRGKKRIRKKDTK